jgi:predicted transposase YbfD/YdcC
MGCQHKIAEHIIPKGVDYVIALKGNQEQLSEEVKAWLHIAEREQFNDMAYFHHKECSCPGAL